MSTLFESESRFCVQGTLGTGDATKVLRVALAEEQLVVVSVSLLSKVAAAQVLFVGDTSGTVKALDVAASLTAHAQLYWQMLEGLKLTKGENLVVTPAAAGPSVHVVVEGYILRGASA